MIKLKKISKFKSSNNLHMMGNYFQQQNKWPLQKFRLKKDSKICIKLAKVRKWLRMCRCRRNKLKVELSNKIFKQNPKIKLNTRIPKHCSLFSRLLSSNPLIISNPLPIPSSLSLHPPSTPHQPIQHLLSSVETSSFPKELKDLKA